MMWLLERGCRHYHHPLIQLVYGFEGGNPFRRYLDRLSGFWIVSGGGAINSELTMAIS